MPYGNAFISESVALVQFPMKKLSETVGIALYANQKSCY